jgi:hypothetical protein
MVKSQAAAWAERLFAIEGSIRGERLAFVKLIEDTADLWNERELFRLEEAMQNVVDRIERIRHKLGDDRTHYDATEEVTRE